MAVIFALAISLLVKFVRPWPLDDSFSVWTWQNSIVVGQYLYIEGGEWYSNSKGDIGLSQLTSTFAIDLSESWTNDTVNALSNSKPKAMQPTRRPFLWYEAQTNYVYEWGGWPYDDNTDYWLWSFQPDGKGSSAWSQNPAPASLGRTLSAPFGSASASSPTAFYALGGAFVPDFTDVNTAMAGLVSYNFSSNSWSNTSSSDFSDTSYSVFAESSFVPTFGMEGLLTFIGGSIPSNQTYLYNLKADLTSMETVAIYDLHSGHWYHQNTTGDVPPVRTKFCSVGAAAPDNSSYEIFIYGGYTDTTNESLKENADGYQEVFVLTIPGFNWFRTSEKTARRGWHHCQTIGNRQMLVIGGAEPDNQPVGAVPDPWTHGLGVFDMTELSWSSSYDAKAQPYEQPSIVKEYYTRNPPQPHEWNDPALAAVFAFNISTKTSPVGNTSPVASSNGAATTTSERSATHRNNVGAIAGGVLGGLVAICIVLGIVLYFLRRQHQKRDVSQPPTSELEKHTPAQELPTGISHRSIHQLGPGDPWELDSTTRNTAPHSPHSDVLR